MPKRDPRIDRYIRDCAPFAQPILKHLRKIIHRACPKAEETIKWGFPHFTYADKILCGMGAFKAHCTFGFWKGSLIVETDGSKAKAAMGQMGRITHVKDLPPPARLASYVKQAMKLNEMADGAPKRPPKHKKKPPVTTPSYFMRALRSDKRALATYEGFSPSHRREYIEWITEAKTEETRERRLETAIQWMSKGKPRNWKYQRR